MLFWIIKEKKHLEFLRLIYTFGVSLRERTGSRIDLHVEHAFEVIHHLKMFRCIILVYNSRHYVCLFGDFRPIREFFTHMETSITSDGLQILTFVRRALMTIEQ